MIIRAETDADIAAITDVTVAAFRTHPFSHQTEHLIVNALRAGNALTISLVAEVDGHVVGHIAFSPVTVSDGTRGWYGLGPVSVLPEQQRQGIGSALINEGLSSLKALGARGCALVGDPQYVRAVRVQELPAPDPRGDPAGGLPGPAVRTGGPAGRGGVPRRIPGNGLNRRKPQGVRRKA